MVGAGCLATDDEGETLVYRLVVPAHRLDMDELKRTLHHFVRRMAALDLAFADNPLEAAAQFQLDDTVTGGDDTGHGLFTPPGMISV
jgi:hypothetical protein